MKLRSTFSVFCIVFGALTISVLVFGAAPVLAVGNEGASGLVKGAAVPRFNLPVINDWKGKRIWGPHKWIGESPKSPKKIVVMSFFATYCEPCKKEMPELVRLHNKYEGAGLGVMLVSIDKNKDEEGHLNRDKLMKLATINKVTFPVLHDRFNIVARKYEAVRLPYMLIVDASGHVRKSHVGYTEELKASLENEIRVELGLGPLPKRIAKIDDDRRGNANEMREKRRSSLTTLLHSDASTCAAAFRKFHTPMWLGPLSPLSHRSICRGQCHCVVD